MKVITAVMLIAIFPFQYLGSMQHSLAAAASTAYGGVQRMYGDQWQ